MGGTLGKLDCAAASKQKRKGRSAQSVLPTAAIPKAEAVRSSTTPERLMPAEHSEGNVASGGRVLSLRQRRDGAILNTSGKQERVHVKQSLEKLKRLSSSANSSTAVPHVSNAAGEPTKSHSEGSKGSDSEGPLEHLESGDSPHSLKANSGNSRLGPGAIPQEERAHFVPPLKKISRKRRLKRKSTLPEIAQRISLDSMLKLALCKIYREAITKTVRRSRGRGLNAHDLRNCISNINFCGLYAEPTRHEIRSLIREIGTSTDEFSGEDDRNSSATETTFHSDASGYLSSGSTTVAMVVTEDKFVAHFLELAKKCGEQSAFGPERQCELAARLIREEYDSRLIFLHKLFKLYCNKQGLLTYEELAEIMAHVAPAERHELTPEDACRFLAAIKKSAKTLSKADLDGNMLDLRLSEVEFTTYLLRGMYQSRKALKAFCARSALHRKISYCIAGAMKASIDESRSREKRQSGIAPHVAVETEQS